MQLVCLCCYILYKENTVDSFLLHFIILMYSLPPLNSLFQVMELWCHSKVLLIFVPENCKKKKKKSLKKVFKITPLFLIFQGVYCTSMSRGIIIFVYVSQLFIAKISRCLTAEQQTLRVVVKRTIVPQSRGPDCTSLASFRLTTWENQKCPTQGCRAASWLTWDQERR